MIEISILIFSIVCVLLISATVSWYRIVDPSEAHLVVTPKGKFVVSSDDKVATNNKKTYFAISNWVPFIGRSIRVMSVTIKEIVTEQETYEKGQARYNVKSSTKYRIKDVQIAAETFIDDDILKQQLKEVINSSIRAVTVKYDVKEARANKKKMDEEIKKEMSDDLSKWGLELINFQLVDFQDTKDSRIISDISQRREIEIQSETRELNAEKIKQANMKESEAEEKSKQREIAKERLIGESIEIKKQKIAEQEKIAEEERYKVIEVQTIQQTKINKEKAIIEANQAKETEEIIKEQKLLEGTGDRLRAEQQSKGKAAETREEGYAEADAKEKLQIALNKFEEKAIRALVAEKIVSMQKKVGVETARALSKADVKVFSGGNNSKSDGFDLGKLISSMSVADENTSNAALNKIARPNDLGLSVLGLKSIKETTQNQTKKIK